MDVKKKNPPAPVSQRVQKWRKKKNNDEDFRKKENKRIEAIRKARFGNMDDDKKEKYRAACAERKRKSRAKKIQSSENILTPQRPGTSQESSSPASDISSPRRGYKTPQSLGKALRKTYRSLPYSPTKKKAVISGLARRVGLDLQKQMDEKLTKPAESNVDSEIRNFYFRSDIVYTAPGMKDEMVVWENGKTRLRKYYLVMFLKEAHMIYLSHSPVSYSKFCELRPKNVLLLKDSPLDQCLCKHHENFRLKLKAMEKSYDEEWWAEILCNSMSNDLNSDCWKGFCTVCGEGKLINPYIFCTVDPPDPAIWHEWRKDPLGKMSKVALEGCCGEIYARILEDLPKFQEHVRIKRIQASAFESDKSDIGKRILQVDFVMAYSCDYQNEIQSALWSRESVQLFTAALFCEGKCSQTFLVCSDTNDKGKDSIYTFLMRLYDMIFASSDSPNIEDIIYSDGPSSEFKNKYMVKLLWHLSKKFGKNFQWKYFATSHGKGVVDEIGGRAKSLVRLKTMSKAENVVVQTSTDFARVASELLVSTKVLHVSQAEIDETIDSDQPWKDVISIAGIQKMHVMKCNSESGVIHLWKTNKSASEHPDIQTDFYSKPGSASNLKIQMSELKVGDWCAVRYDSMVYCGEIQPLRDSFVTVNVMVPCGKYWKWPSKDDIFEYNIQDALKKLLPPNVVGSRGQFSFEDFAP